MEDIVCCQLCLEEQKNNDIFFIDVDEDYFNGKTVKCNNNHTFFIIPTKPRHGYLFKMAIDSFKKKNYSECVLMLYSGYEDYLLNFTEAYLYEQVKDVNEVNQIIRKNKQS